MTWLDDIGAIDVREKLPRRRWTIGERRATTSITWHYNGPPVASYRQAGAGLLEQLVADSYYQMREGWGGTVGGAPHLMYHLVIGADGAIWQTADEREILWHCAHADGNGAGLALHVPIGQGQQPSSAQLASLIRATIAAQLAYAIPTDRVLGHLEWKHATACPGPALMQHLLAYRAGRAPTVAPTPIPAGLRRWQVNPLYTDSVRVHTAPSIAGPIATRLKPGTIVYVDVVKPSEIPDGLHPTWVHMAKVPNEQADAGFVAEDCGVWL